MKLRDVGENALIRKIREKFKNPGVPLGIGDDAAILNIPSRHSLIACSDLIAENTHFLRDIHPPESLGYKSVAVNVSDVGAMGGIPMYFLMSIAVPADLEWDWIEGFLDGIDAACRAFDILLIGGDSSSSDRIFVDVSMLGRIQTGHGVSRAGAQAGDGIYVTGELGGASLGLELLMEGQRSHPAVHRHLHPEPRHRAGAAVVDIAHAMIDVSDGLSTDLNHIVTASKVSDRIYKNLLPVVNGSNDLHALHGGEEYELIIVAPSLPSEIEGVRVTRIGEIIPSVMDHQTFLIDGANESVLQPRGWQHF
jgi:thiamine-monophosphate kinase